jgi:hypothetical protein
VVLLDKPLYLTAPGSARDTIVDARIPHVSGKR